MLSYSPLRLLAISTSMLLMLLAGTAVGRLHLKPMQCHRAELHGLTDWTYVSQAFCAVYTYNCWYVNESRPVPGFAKESKSMYYKGDCGTCPANEKSCVTCTEPFCNFHAKKSKDRLYKTDLMGLLSPVWARRLTKFEYMLRAAKAGPADAAKPKRPRIQVSSD